MGQSTLAGERGSSKPLDSVEDLGREAKDEGSDLAADPIEIGHPKENEGYVRMLCLNTGSINTDEGHPLTCDGRQVFGISLAHPEGSAVVCPAMNSIDRQYCRNGCQ